MKSNVTTVTRQGNLKSLITLGAYFGALIALYFLSSLAFASGGPSDGSLGDVAGTITGSMTNVAKLITAASYVAGIGFAMMGMLKLKAHKDNPTQVPLSQPIVLLCIAAGLVFLPNLISTGGATIWGSSDEGRGSATGEGLVDGGAP